MENREKLKSHQDLLVWQKGMALAESVYKLSSQSPVDERYGLIAQVRRAAVSVPCNIAEGQARHSTKEFLPFLPRAQGSLAEIETQLLLSVYLGFANEQGVASGLKAIDELQKIIVSLSRKLEGGSSLVSDHPLLAASRPH